MTDHQIDRAKTAIEYRAAGMNCAQAVAGAFADVIGLDVKKIFALTGTFGGGFQAHELCGAIAGAAMVLGARYPHDALHDMRTKSATAKRMQAFNRRFLERFPHLTCRELRDTPADCSACSSAERLGLSRACEVYVAAAAEILEEMLAEE